MKLKTKTVTAFLRKKGFKVGRVYRQAYNLKFYGQRDSSEVMRALRLRYPSRVVYVEHDTKWRKNCPCCGHELDIGNVYLQLEPYL